MISHQLHQLQQWIRGRSLATRTDRLMISLMLQLREMTLPLSSSPGLPARTVTIPVIRDH